MTSRYLPVQPLASTSNSAILQTDTRSSEPEIETPLEGNTSKEVKLTTVTPLHQQQTSASGTVLPTAFRQLRWDLVLSLGMIPLSILLFLYLYATLVSNTPPLGPLLFSPSRTLLVVTILSQGLGIIFRVLFSSVFDALRWHFASREKGVSITVFLGLSPATSSLGVIKLLYSIGLRSRAWWCLQRLVLPILCILVGVILKGDIAFDTTYEPLETQSVIAGLAPINIPLLVNHLPVAVAWIYFSTYSISILGNGNFVTGIDPIACTGTDCLSVFLPGSLQVARRVDHLNGTLLNLNDTLFINADAVVVYNAPGYQLDFYPGEQGFVFDKTQECMTFGETRGQGLFMCVSSNGSAIIAGTPLAYVKVNSLGWSICPTAVYTSGGCFNDTSWTDELQQTTSMSIFKRYSTTAYDSRNLSIRSVESISVPQPVELDPLDLRTVFTAILTPGLTNSSDDTEAIDAGLYYIGWALRAYQDEFTSDLELPLTLLRGILTVPVQFATMAWEWVNATATTNTTEFALPQDLETTAATAKITYRAKAKPWTVCVFMSLTALLLIWCNSVLLWIVTQKSAAPNLSDFVEVDIGSKSTFSLQTPPELSDGRSGSGELEDWSTTLRSAGLGNAESRSVIQSLKNSNIRVAAVRSSQNEINLVLVTGHEDSKGLEDARNLESPKRGEIYK